jgi:FkbM family methyltransferase
MKRSDRIKLNFLRNWKLPGRERLSYLFKPSFQLRASFNDGIVWLTDEDIAIYTTADNYIEWTILSTGTYEDQINKLIRISLKPGGIALDIGANIGLQSIRMSQCAGCDGKVYAFEPLAHLQKKFNKNVELNNAGNVKLFPFALSDSESERDFNINKNAWNQGTFSLRGQNTGTETQRVSIKAADEVAEIKALERLDLVKIDVEGFEYQVLKGLNQTLMKYKPRIIFEYNVNYWKSAGQHITECFNFLHLLNYIVYQITPVGCERVNDPETISGGNLFCVQQ